MGTIENDDAAPTLTINDVSHAEGNSRPDRVRLHGHEEQYRQRGDRRLRDRRRHRDRAWRLRGRERHAQLRCGRGDEDDHRARQRRHGLRGRTRPSSSTSRARAGRRSPTARARARSRTTTPRRTSRCRRTPVRPAASSSPTSPGRGQRPTRSTSIATARWSSTTANTGAFTDPLGKPRKGTVFVYRVCQAGTQICSNDAIVVSLGRRRSRRRGKRAVPRLPGERLERDDRPRYEQGHDREQLGACSSRSLRWRSRSSASSACSAPHGGGSPGALLRAERQSRPRSAEPPPRGRSRGAGLQAAAPGSYVGLDTVNLEVIDPRLSMTLVVSSAKRGRFCLTESVNGRTWSLAGPVRREAEYSAQADCSRA